MAWYWCARATLDHNTSQSIKGCTALANAHDRGIGTTRSATAALEIFATLCTYSARSEASLADPDAALSCASAGRLSFETHPRDASRRDFFLVRAYKSNPWRTYTAVSQVWSAAGDIADAAEVLRWACRKGKEDGCDGLRDLGELTNEDTAAFNAVKERERVQEEFDRAVEEAREEREAREHERTREAEEAEESSSAASASDQSGESTPGADWASSITLSQQDTEARRELERQQRAEAERRERERQAEQARREAEEQRRREEERRRDAARNQCPPTSSCATIPK
jgi:hypothetical protein